MVIDAEGTGAPASAVSWNDYVADGGDELRALLESGADEPQLQQWLERHPAWVPGIDDGRGSGHHGPLYGVVMTQPPLKGLGTKVPDFLVLTGTSGVVVPVLVEIEDLQKRWFTAKGHPTQKFVQARDQLNEWRTWFGTSTNKQVFLDMYQVPEEMRRHLGIRPGYRLVYGRAGEFGRHGPHADGDRLNRKRDTLADRDEVFQTWDTLAAARPNAASVITARVGDAGYSALHVPDTFDLARDLFGTCERVRDLDAAIVGNERIDPARRKWLLGRAAFWRAEADRRAAGGRPRLPR